MVVEHKKRKSGFAAKIAMNASDMGKQMRNVDARWRDDVLCMSWMNIHALYIIIAGDPDTAASKHNTIVYGTPAIRKWAEAELPVKSSLLPKIHSYIVVHQGETGIRPKERPKQMPPNMHATRAACTTEIARLLEEQSGVPVGNRFPWGNLPHYLIRHRLHINNWPGKHEFPGILDINVSRVRTDQWGNMWKRLFVLDDGQEFRVSKLDIADDEELSANTVLVEDSSHRLLTVDDVLPAETLGKHGAEAEDGVEDNGTEGTRPKRRKKGAHAKDGVHGGRKKKGKKHPLSHATIDDDQESAGDLALPSLGDSQSLGVGDPQIPPDFQASSFIAAPQTGLDASQIPESSTSTGSWDLGEFNFSNLNLDCSQFPGLDMSQNLDLFLGGPSTSMF